MGRTCKWQELEKFCEGDVVELTERGYRKFRFYTRWGFTIFGQVVRVTEKGDCMLVCVEGRVSKWHKTYWTKSTENLRPALPDTP